MTLTATNLSLEIPLRDSSKKVEQFANPDGCVYLKDRKSYLVVAELCAQFLRESFTITQDQYLNYLTMKKGVNMQAETLTPYNLTETQNSHVQDFCLDKSEVLFKSEHFVLSNCSLFKKSALQAENVFTEQVLPRQFTKHANKRSLVSTHHNYSTNMSYNNTSMKSTSYNKMADSNYRPNLTNERLDFEAIIRKTHCENSKNHDFLVDESIISHKSCNYLNNDGRTLNDGISGKYALSKKSNDSSILKSKFEPIDLDSSIAKSKFEPIDLLKVSKVSDFYPKSELNIDDFTINQSKLQENNLRYLKNQTYKKRMPSNIELDKIAEMRLSMGSKNSDQNQSWYANNDYKNTDFDTKATNFFTNFNTDLISKSPEKEKKIDASTPFVSPDKHHSNRHKVQVTNIEDTNFKKNCDKKNEGFNIDSYDMLKYKTLRQMFDKDQRNFNYKNSVEHSKQIDDRKVESHMSNSINKLSPYCHKDKNMIEETVNSTMPWYDFEFMQKFNMDNDISGLSRIEDKSFSLLKSDLKCNKGSKSEKEIPKLKLNGADLFNPYNYVSDSCQISMSSRSSNKYSIKSSRAKNDESFNESIQMKDFLSVGSGATNEELTNTQKAHETRIKNLENLEKKLDEKLLKIETADSKSDTKSKTSNNNLSYRKKLRKNKEFVEGFE